MMDKEGIEPELVIREGEKAEQVVAQIAEDKEVAILIPRSRNHLKTISVCILFTTLTSDRLYKYSSNSIFIIITGSFDPLPTGLYWSFIKL
jgi:hypothetical protein